MGGGDSKMMAAKYYEPDEISFLLSGTYPSRSFFFSFKYFLPYFPLI